MEAFIIIQTFFYFVIGVILGGKKEVQTASLYCPLEAKPGLHNLIENSDLSYLSVSFCAAISLT